jgi:hypothetical protein
MAQQIINVVFQISEKSGLYVLPMLAMLWVPMFTYWAGLKLSGRKKIAVPQSGLSARELQLLVPQGE